VRELSHKGKQAPKTKGNKMQTATLELTESDWVKIILALHSKAEARELEEGYCKSLETLANEIEELVKVQID
jgi:hypothetical protein